MRAALMIATLLLAPGVYAQKATEQYIPIGKSPGISGTYSYIGKIDHVDPQNRTIVVAGPKGKRTIKITDETKIWLDSSEIGKTNGPGSHADCKRGRLCEIKYAYDGETRTEEAEWIKIRVGDSD